MSNHTLLLETAATVRDYVEGQVDLDALQAKLQSVMALLENTDDGAEVAGVIRNVEGDLELISFTVFGDEVRPAVLSALEPLAPHLPRSTPPTPPT